MDHLEQVLKAITLIEDHLFDQRSISDVSYDVYSSRFHFHRIFRSVTGSSVYQYILSRKLSEAAKLLLETELPISEIAFKIGFNSHEGFTRAFSKRIGISPSTYRNGQNIFSIMPTLDIFKSSLKIGILESPKIIDFKEVRLVGIHSKGCYTRSKIASSWFELLQLCPQIQNLTKDYDSFGVIPSNSWNHSLADYNFYACKRVTDFGAMPQNLHRLKIPSGKYWHILFRGRRSDITKFYKSFYENHSEIDTKAMLIEYQNKHFLSPEISPRELLVPIL